jgi:hypothetical protein
MNNICSYDDVALTESAQARRRRIVEASYCTDLPLKEFAASQGIGFSTLGKWRKMLKSDSSPAFLPVELNDAAPKQEPVLSCSADPVSPTRVAITLVSGCTLDVREDISITVLKRLLNAMAQL